MPRAANFVDIIGYSLEKVHTGMLAWLLEFPSQYSSSALEPISIDQRGFLLKKLSKAKLRTDGIVEICCKKEHPLKGRIRSDLYVEIHYADGSDEFLIIEMKTDSDVSAIQLRKMNEACRKDSHEFTLICLGASQFTLENIEKENNPIPNCWNQIKLGDFLNLLRKLDCSDTLFEQWLSALEKKQDRFKAFLRADKPIVLNDRSNYYAFFDAIWSVPLRLDSWGVISYLEGMATKESRWHV